MTQEVLMILGGCVLAVFVLPLAVYLGVKMARLGWLMANRKYRQLTQKEKTHGNP